MKTPEDIGRSKAVTAVFEDFVARLRVETQINRVAIKEIEKCLTSGHFSAEKLKMALFTEESL
jgi:hypothetical protein